jgi:hypothetical protein
MGVDSSVGCNAIFALHRHPLKVLRSYCYRYGYLASVPDYMSEGEDNVTNRTHYFLKIIMS